MDCFGSYFYSDNLGSKGPLTGASRVEVVF